MNGWRIASPLLAIWVVVVVIVSPLAVTSAMASSDHDRSHGIVGTYEGLVKGAQYEPHLYQFHADGTMLGTNPQRVQEKPDGSGVNDSVAFGDWWTEHGQIVGVFKELNANQTTHKPADDLTVRFRLKLKGDHLSGTAKVFVGTEQVPDAEFILDRIS